MSSVVPLFPIPERRCASCAAPHKEIGQLCKDCRAEQPALGDTFIQATIASSIVDLERWEAQGNPLSGPLARALDGMRKAYDAAEPRVLTAVPGYVQEIDGELWAFTATGQALGPFGNEEAAQEALNDYRLRCP